MWLGVLRIGEGEEWRDHWLALAFEIGAEDTLDAVQMAAKLLRCLALVLGLTSAIASGDGQVKTLAIAVIRRWVLTLQAMAWLEAALTHAWSDVRPKDLCCFALNATNPDWPRRVLAISHRSKDVKPALRGMHAWRAGRIAIDANYIPSGNQLGMVWGLFAAMSRSPASARPPTTSLVWCRRELELTDYLASEAIS